MDAVTDRYSVTEWLRPDRKWAAYMGVMCQQFWSDLLRYAQIVNQYVPAFIIEIGRADGGTALYLADQLHAVNPTGIVISIDVDPKGCTVHHDNIRHLVGRSTDPDIVGTVTELTAGRRGVVLLDGDHSSFTVAHELDLYADMANYLIVEDTILRWLTQFGDDGPHVALDRWLPLHPEFVPDPDPIPTQHPGGWLRRKAR